MKIKTLNLTNFRSYPKLNLKLSDKTNVFIGDNGEGKTNILEAIYTLAIVRSYKAKDDDMIERGKDFFKIEANIEFDNREEKLVLINSKQGKKALKDDVEIKKISDFVGLVNIILFSPEDLLLLKSGPSERRKLIDLFLLQISKKYIEDSQAFKKQHKLRNDYLKYLQPKVELDKDINDDMLNILTTNFININNEIFNARRTFIERLEETINPIYKNLSGSNDAIKIEYICNFENTIDFFKEKYKQDIILGATQYGCHRDDIKFYRNGVDFENNASQGELRILSLSIKLAMAKIIQMLKKEKPIILLDDVLSELDINHQNKLIRSLDKSVQTIITTTDVSKISLSSLKEVKIFEIKNHQVEEK
ncbi:MAG: DNA replication/repair protein RecF [Gammaproteobacteria bacterium]|nr:DNA replication/repair protein RecF [Gammaproteobacteria bacterium]